MPSSPFSIRQHRASISPGSNKTFPVTALLRRFSTPSTYTTTGQPVAQSSRDPMNLVDDQAHDASFTPAPSDTVHHYTLTSRGREYALITVISHAPNARDIPLLYFGDELNGFVVLSIDDLNDMQSMDVVLQMFDADQIRPSYEAKRILLSQQVDYSHISGGQFCWPFTIASPTASTSSSSTSSVSSLGNTSPNSYSTRSDIHFQLIVTIYRRGRLNRNIGVRQKISYIPPPDPSMQPVQSSPQPLSIDLPPDPPPFLSWPKQHFPPVRVRGIMFGQVSVEVECKLVAPSSYTTSDIIPLILILISENREALDLLAVSDVIDVRLQKVLGFGEHAATVRPLSLRDRKSFHRTDLAARATWQPDGHVRELLPDKGHRLPRWSVQLNGSLQREAGVELSPSFEHPGMALMYVVSLFTFRSMDFRPAGDPNKALVMGKIQLTAPRPRRSEN